MIPRIGDSGLHVKSSTEPKLMSLALRETADTAVNVHSVRGAPGQNRLYPAPACSTRY
jgi:hypothetical protein